MDIPIYLSVAKASAYMKAESARIRQIAAEDWENLQTAHAFFRPFLATWIWMVHAFRWVCFSGRYLVLVCAWTFRVTGIITVIIAIVWFLDPSFFKASTPYTPPTSTKSHSYSNSGSGNHSYSNTQQASSAQRAQNHQYDNPSTSSSSGYQPRVRHEDVAEISKGIYDIALKKEMVDVSGHYRGDTYVQPHQRQPPGGLDNTEAAALAVGAAAVIYGVDYLDQKYDSWSAKREAKARQKAEEKERRELDEYLARIEAEKERKRANKRSWWGGSKSNEKNPFSILEKEKSWWER